MEDCCGFCPKPTTDKEKEVAEEESKIYISGKVSFLTDDPGRQVRKQTAVSIPIHYNSDHR